MMRVLFRALGVSAALALSPAAGHAQAPTPEAMSAKPTVPPKPARLPDGKPNWTGFWVLPGGMMEVYTGPSGISGSAGGATANTPLAVRNIPALKSPYKEAYEKRMEEAKKGPLPDPTSTCLPSGMPRMMGMIYGMEFLQTPKVIAITSEYGAATRRIWMDLKAHPPEDELEESYTGHSIGRWEGGTLIVDTVGIREDVQMDQSGLRHSKHLHIVERFTQTAPGILVIETTMEDKEAFERPWTQKRTFRYRPDLRLREYVCLENNRNVDSQGLPTFK